MQIIIFLNLINLKIAHFLISNGKHPKQPQNRQMPLQKRHKQQVVHPPVSIPQEHSREGLVEPRYASVHQGDREFRDLSALELFLNA